MLLGVHVCGAGKIYETLERAHALGCNTMQVFSRSPQRWREKFLGLADIQEFKRRQAKLKINPVFIHIPYLINLASPEENLYEASVKAYIEDIQEATSLGAHYIVTHMGSHKDTCEEEGLRRLTAALKRILEETKGSTVGILLENTSGSGSWLGYTFRHHKEVLSGLNGNPRIGLCLDTAHAYSAGFDISKKEGLASLLKDIDSLLSLERLKLIHLNDALDTLGSHRDRHAHIGQGKIGLTGMKRIINHPSLKKLAFILETPKSRPDDDAKNLRTVRKLRAP
jgi:deoxyribonuclease IV